MSGDEVSGDGKTEVDAATQASASGVAALAEDRIVGKRYRLVAPLGEGGMAVVWRAQHTETDRTVALKIVRRELARDEKARELFVREARIAARIGRSEFIVDVLDAGIDEELSAPFLAMELLRGEPLDERLSERGPIAYAEARRLLGQVAEALDQAHEAGVIHRDLKPHNLFVTSSKKGDVIKVLDFGIAKLAETAAVSSTQVGTPAYCAPEQLGPTWRRLAEERGRRIAEQVSPATDVFALGVVAYEMLVGARPGELWQATTLAELPVKMVFEPIPVASAAAARAGKADLLPNGFDAWLARCLALDATHRFPSAGDAVAALPEHFETLSGVDVRHPSAVPMAAVAASVAATPMVAGHTPAPTPSAAHTPAPSAHAQSAVPPAPGGSQFPPAAQTGDPAWDEWLSRNQAALRQHGDARVYNAWQPLHFIPSVMRVACEIAVTIADAQVLIGETVAQDEALIAMGEAKMLFALVPSARITGRIALRTKKLTSLGDSISRGLRALDGLVSQPTGITSIGDTWLESRFQLLSPSAAEGHAALPIGVRQLLLQEQLNGALECRPGGAVIAFFDPVRFDTNTVDRMCAIAHRLLVPEGG